MRVGRVGGCDAREACRERSANAHFACRPDLGEAHGCLLGGAGADSEPAFEHRQHTEGELASRLEAPILPRKIESACARALAVRPGP